MATLVQTKSLLNDFRKWLKSNQCISSGGNYNSWLINFPSRLIYKPLPYPDYLDTITDLILAGYPVYAVGLCDKVMSILQTNLNARTNSYLQNAQSSLYQFRAYLCSQLFSLFPLVPPPVPTLSPAVFKAAKGVAKGKLEGIIDGTNTLLNGALAHARINFVKLAIESSLFFSADIVGERCNELSKMFNSKANVPARYTDDKTICTAPVKGRPAVYNIGGKSYNVIVDKDGNDFVRKLINDKTGYTVSTGKSSIITGYVISHVWGRAFDPRYFTNFWNIVLIPSWANPLMDVPNPPKHSYASRLQNTIMAICEKLHAGTTCNLPPVSYPKDVVHCIYKVSVINPKGSLPLGTITKISVTV